MESIGFCYLLGIFYFFGLFMGLTDKTQGDFADRTIACGALAIAWPIVAFYLCATQVLEFFKDIRGN